MDVKLMMMMMIMMTSFLKLFLFSEVNNLINGRLCFLEGLEVLLRIIKKLGRWSVISAMKFPA